MKRILAGNDNEFESALKHARDVTHDTASHSAADGKIEATARIVDRVRAEGDAAVAEFTEKFDGVSLSPDQFEVSAQEIDAAVNQVDSALIDSLTRARDNIQAFHQKNLRESWEETLDDGSVLGQRVTPIARVGVYVPGGKAFYPSSVLMNIVPARVAGVEDIVMVSPPSYQGSVHPVVLAAAKLAGATQVYRIGGAQSIAALAYGTESIPPVMKITGPGNTYVTAAKALARNVCDIDTEAGPSEVVVIADETADPRRVAAELLAQAEHDEEACSILISTSAELVDAVEKVIDEELENLSRAEIIRESLTNTGTVFVVRNVEEAAAISNVVAPEHLAIYTRDARADLDRITDAGSIMVGQDTTVVYGDYFAGPNHILPTGRRARFASPLSAEDFRKTSSIIQFSETRARAVSDDVSRLARAEELTAHARAAELRK